MKLPSFKYGLTVKLKEYLKSVKSATTTVIIEINDLNDNEPQLTVEPGTFEIEENRGTGAEVRGPAIRVTDADVNFLNSKWKIEVVNSEECPVEAQPSQGSGNMDVTLRTAKSFDYEEMKKCEAILRVTDDSNLNSQGNGSIT